MARHFTLGTDLCLPSPLSSPIEPENIFKKLFIKIPPLILKACRFVHNGADFSEHKEMKNSTHNNPLALCALL
jgi:hypothetical protein